MLSAFTPWAHPVSVEGSAHGAWTRPPSSKSTPSFLLSCQCHLRPDRPVAPARQPRRPVCEPGSQHRHGHQRLATHHPMPGGALLVQKNDPVLLALLDLLLRLGLSAFTRIPELSLMLFAASRSPSNHYPTV